MQPQASLSFPKILSCRCPLSLGCMVSRCALLLGAHQCWQQPAWRCIGWSSGECVRFACFLHIGRRGNLCSRPPFTESMCTKQAYPIPIFQSDYRLDAGLVRQMPQCGKHGQPASFGWSIALLGRMCNLGTPCSALMHWGGCLLVVISYSASLICMPFKKQCPSSMGSCTMLSSMQAVPGLRLWGCVPARVDRSLWGCPSTACPPVAGAWRRSLDFL